MTVTQEQLGSVREDIRAVSDTVMELRGIAADHSYHLTMIRTCLSGVDSRFNRVDGRLDSLQTAVGGLQTAVSDLQGSVNEILTLVRKSQ